MANKQWLIIVAAAAVLALGWWLASRGDWQTVPTNAPVTGTPKK